MTTTTETTERTTVVTTEVTTDALTTAIANGKTFLWFYIILLFLFPMPKISYVA